MATINEIIEQEQEPACPECRENKVPEGTVTGLCYNCEEHSSEPNDYLEEL